MRRALPVLIVTWLGLCAGAAAQTGGRMGGQDFGSVGKAVGGGAGRTIGRRLDDVDLHLTSEGPPTASERKTLGPILIVTAGVIGILVVIVMVRGARFRKRQAALLSSHKNPARPQPVAARGVDVGVLRIAVDGRSRKDVQDALARLATTADTATAAGRERMLREVAVVMRRVRDAWVYVGAVHEDVGDTAEAKRVFDRHVDDARVRFRDETISNVQGELASTPGPAVTPHGEDGLGLALVSIVIAARNKLFTGAQLGDAVGLATALESASGIATSDLVGVEVVWMPSEDSDRLSSLKLEARYPAPELVPIEGARVGKAACAFCTKAYPAELVICPHCGARAAS